MKRISITILSLLYLAITSGVLVNVHYCMGEVAAVDYGHNATTACGACGMEEKEGCCSTETAFVKVSEQQKSNSTVLNDPALVMVATNHATPTTVLLMGAVNISYQPHSPPHPVTPSLNILHRTFRI